MFVFRDERNSSVEGSLVDPPTVTDIEECTTSSSERSLRNTFSNQNNENISSTSVRRKKKKELTAYEEILLELQKENTK